MHWVNVLWWEAALFGCSGAAAVDLSRWWRRRREKEKAPLFLELEGATEWARRNPGKLARWPRGQVRWGGSDDR